MIVRIDDEICSKHNVTKEEVLVLGAIQYGNDDVYQGLINKGYITRANGSMFELDKKYTITHRGISLFSDVVLESDRPTQSTQDRIADLAAKLREIYPEGKMQGTSYYYRGNTPDIKKKLVSFFKRYGDNYTDEQILDATKRYVESFNGSYLYLRLLKYFIWKDENRDGEVVQVSQLAEWIENADQVNPNSYDWTSSIN